MMLLQAIRFTGITPPIGLPVHAFDYNQRLAKPSVYEPLTVAFDVLRNWDVAL